MISTEKAKKALKKLKTCLEHDACCEMECAYFANSEELAALILWVEELMENGPGNAEERDT